MLLVQSENLHS